MRTVVVMAVLGVLLLSAGTAFAQFGYGIEQVPGEMEREKPYMRVKVGWFEPDEGALDGDIAFGVDYVVPYTESVALKQPYDLYVTIDRLHAEDTAVETTAWSIMGGVNLKAASGFYYGGGIGWSRHTLETPGSPDRDDDGFAWELGAGMGLGSKGFAELKYRDGGEDGNTGFLLFVGTQY